MNIAIFTGELSGDLIGGALAWEVRRREPGVHIWGLGSAAMRNAGVELLADSASWGAISISEAVTKVPALLVTIAPMVRRELRARRPDAVVLVDFGAFNVRAARFCKQIGLKVCYYFPPGSWRRGGVKGSEFATIADVVATPFPWAAERLRNLGVNAINVGHPLLERVHAVLTRQEFAAQFGMDETKPIIGLLPGSRHHEVAHLMPILLDAARLIYRKHPDAQFVVGVAPSISPELMESYLEGHAEFRGRIAEIWHEFASEAENLVLKPVARTAKALRKTRTPLLVTQNGVLVPADTLRSEMEARRRSEHLRARADQAIPPTVLAKGLTYDVMAHCDVLLTCSGTATLEAAIFETPMVILYRGSKIMELEYRLRGLDKKIRFVGLPNILADRLIVPELIQWAATPQSISENALALLDDVEKRARVKEDLRAVRESLGSPGASERTARLVLDLAQR